MGQSSTLNIFVSHFRFVASFRKEGDSKARQISHISPSAKIRGGMGEMYKSIFQVHPRMQPLIYFWWVVAALSELGLT